MFPHSIISKLGLNRFIFPEQLHRTVNANDISEGLLLLHVVSLFSEISIKVKTLVSAFFCFTCNLQRGAFDDCDRIMLLKNPVFFESFA